MPAVAALLDLEHLTQRVQLLEDVLTVFACLIAIVDRENIASLHPVR